MMPQKTQKDAEETKAKFFGVFPRLLRPKLKQKPYEYYRALLPSFPKHIALMLKRLENVQATF
jgi:hypothetical protein